MIPACQSVLGQENTPAPNTSAPDASAEGNEIQMPDVYKGATVLIPVTNADTVLIDRKDIVDYKADVPADDPRIILQALKKGEARVSVQVKGKTTVYVVHVLDTDEADLNNQQATTVRKIKNMLSPEAAKALKISFAGNGENAAMVLQGTMPDDVVARKVLAIAMQFTPTVLNYLTIDEPLQLRVKCDVVEADEGDTSHIGMRYRSASGVNDFEVPLGISVPRLLGQGGAGSGNWLFPFDPANSSQTEPFGFTPSNLASASLGNYGFAIQPTLALSRILSNSRILQSPTLTVINGQAAGVSIGDTIQLPTTTTTTTGTQQSYEAVFAGVMIRLAPLIPGVKEFDTNQAGEATIPAPVSQRGTEGNAVDGVNSTVPMIDSNGLIRLYINVQVTAFKSDAALSALPIVTGRTIITCVAMRDGESLVLGGLINDTMSKNMEKMPFLSDIPLLGELFKDRTKDGSKSELIFVITPRIIHKETVAKGDTYIPKLSDMAGQMNEYSILQTTKPTRISARDVLVRPEEETGTVPEPSKMLLPRPALLQLPENDTKNSTTPTPATSAPATTPPPPAPDKSAPGQLVPAAEVPPPAKPSPTPSADATAPTVDTSPPEQKNK